MSKKDIIPQRYVTKTPQRFPLRDCILASIAPRCSPTINAYVVHPYSLPTICLFPLTDNGENTPSNVSIISSTCISVHSQRIQSLSSIRMTSPQVVHKYFPYVEMSISAHHTSHRNGQVRGMNVINQRMDTPGIIVPSP